MAKPSYLKIGIALAIIGLAIILWPCKREEIKPDPIAVIKADTQRILNADTADRGTRLWDLINGYREGKGLERWRIGYGLCGYARERLEEIRYVFSHQSFRDNEDKFEYCGYCKALGENLARNWNGQRELLNGWMNSPKHNAILLGDYTFGCVAVEKVDGKYSAVLEVGR